MSPSIRGMNEDESRLLMWISTDEDECIATERADRGGEDKTDAMKDAKKDSTVTAAVLKRNWFSWDYYSQSINE